MKILIVEDEQLTRESLSFNLKKLGYEDILEASDGLDAMEKFREYAPDIILADIKMPKMDGLQFLSELRKANHNTIFIIISSYDLFEYARKAIQHGVFSYLLKPIKNEELNNCLLNAQESILQSKSESDKNITSKIKVRKYMDMAKKQLIQSLVESDNQDDTYTKSRLSEVDINFEHKNFLITVAQIDNLEELTQITSHEDMQLYKFCIENIACEILSENGILAFPFSIEGGQGFLLNIPSFDDSLQLQLKDIFIKVKEALSSCMNFTITIGVGSVVDKPSQFPTSFEYARKAVMSRLSDGGNRVYFYKSMEDRSSAGLILIDYEMEQKIFISFEKCDKTALLGIIEGLYKLYSSPSDGKLFMKLNFQLVLTIFKVLNQIGINPEQLFGNEFKIYNQLNTCSNIESILDLYSKIINTCFESIEGTQKLWSKKIMARAMEYIINNYNKNIGLNNVSDYVNMSPAYFSKQFKLEYNENFIDYLIRYRINKAQEFLKEGTYTASEVSKMVGFNDDKYFYKTFKKIVGITPGSYRKGM